MLDAVCCARNLTKRLGFFQPKNPEFKKGWLTTAGELLQQTESWGIPYPCEIHSFDLEGIDSIVMSYVKIGQNKKISIFVNDINNICWKRFYICKEIIHVLASDGENATRGSIRINEVIEQIQTQSFFQTSVDKAYQIEIDAHLGAIELLLPKEVVEREDSIIGHDLRKYDDARINDIAERYKVPKIIVKTRMSQSGMRLAFDKCYEAHKYRNADFLAVMS